MLELVQNAGPFAFLNVAVGAVGILLALAALATGKSKAGQVLGVLALVLALITLALGFAGSFLGMTATHAALGNVPDDQRDLLLRKGTEESRGNLIIALGGALLPLLAGLLSAARNGFKPGVVLGGLAVLSSVAMGVQVASPLPPEGPPYVEPPGLVLAQSSSPRVLHAASLVALTPDGLWANGARVSSLPEALAEPLVQARNASTLPVMVDAKVTFAALADLLEAVDKTGRDAVQLVVTSPSGEHRVVSVFTHPEPAPKDKAALELLLAVNEKNFVIGTLSGNTLDPLPRADVPALGAKLGEVKANFPDIDTIRVTAEAELPFSELVKVLDATVMREQRLLFPTVVVGRFEFAPLKNDGLQIGNVGTQGAGYGTGTPAP